MNLDCSQILPSTEIDVWHANDAGDYDNVGYNLRGVTTSNVSGFYIFETIYPGKYLNGSSYRPAHIHFRITPPGFPLLITQLYFQGDSDIPGDAAASVTSGTYDATHRIIPVTPDGSGGLEGTWDIMIDGSGTPVGVDELHLENGMIYQANPNPFIDEVTINYGVFKEAKVQIDVYNVHGQLVADLGAEIHAPDKYSVVWQPEIELPSGHYFISLKMNDMQVHYIKVVKA